jgi:DNA primase
MALTRFLKTHPEISDGAACTDNDEVGDRAAEEIRDTLDEFGIANCRMRAPYAKDWNEALLAIQKSERLQGRSQLETESR